MVRTEVYSFQPWQNNKFQKDWKIPLIITEADSTYALRIVWSDGCSEW